MTPWSVVFSPEAKDDLISLFDWIARSSGPEVAGGYIDRIEAFCVGLGRSPHRGHLRRDIRENLRIIGFERRVSIAFMVEPDQVVILRLAYGGRNWEAEF